MARRDRIAQVLAGILVFGAVSMLALSQTARRDNDFRVLGEVESSPGFSTPALRVFTGGSTQQIAYPRREGPKAWITSQDGRRTPALAVVSVESAEEVLVRIPEGNREPLERPQLEIQRPDGTFWRYPLNPPPPPKDVQPRFVGKAPVWRAVRDENSLTTFVPPELATNRAVQLNLVRSDLAEFERELPSPTGGWVMSDGSVLTKVPWAKEANWFEGSYRTVQSHVSDHTITFRLTRTGSRDRRNVVTGSPVEVTKIRHVSISLPERVSFRTNRRPDADQLIVFLRVRDSKPMLLTPTRGPSRPGTYLQRVELDWVGPDPATLGYHKLWLNGILIRRPVVLGPPAKGPLPPITVRLRMFWEEHSKSMPVRIVPDQAQQLQDVGLDFEPGQPEK